MKFQMGGSYEKHIKGIEDYIESLKNRLAFMQERLDNYNKDEHIQSLNNQIEEMNKRSIHVMSEQESKDAKEFQTKHYESCNQGAVEYILMGTGIGTGVSVRCRKCNTEKNITDYSRW